MQLDLNIIANWEKFEDMVAIYFKEVQKQENNITEVKVEPSGNGADGGRDILVTFRVNDSIKPFDRKWVIQCKFHDGILKEREISTINIPTKIHEYSADGFLLIVKDRVHGNITKMFENLNRECRFKYCYEIWNGEDLKNKIQSIDPVLKQFFSKYYHWTKKQENKLKGII